MISLPAKSVHQTFTEFVQATLEHGLMAAQAFIARTRTGVHTFRGSVDALQDGFRAASLLLDASKLDRTAAKHNQPLLIQPESADKLDRMLLEFAQVTKELRLEGDPNVGSLYQRLVQRLQHRMPKQSEPPAQPAQPKAPPKQPDMPHELPPAPNVRPLPSGPNLQTSYNKVARTNGEYESAQQQAQSSAELEPPPTKRQIELAELTERGLEYQRAMREWQLGPKTGPPPELDPAMIARMRAFMAEQNKKPGP